MNCHKIDKLNRNKDWTLKLGDLQEHKYNNQKAWIPNAIPHYATEHLEHVGKLMNAHFDLKEGELISPWILRDKIEKEE